MRGDDGFGPSLAERIPCAINAGNSPENFISKITREKPDTVVIFDAVDFGGEAGEIRVFDAKQTVGPLVSTHAVPLSKFAQALEPARTWIIGIQPGNIGFGEAMSREALESTESIGRELSAWFEGRRGKND